MDTAYKTVTFRFAPDFDKPNVMVRNLVKEDLLTECHMNAVEEQLEKIIEVIKENPKKSAGLRLTSIVEQQPSVENIALVIRQQPMEIHHPTISTPSEENKPIVPAVIVPAQTNKISRFSVVPAQLNGTTTETTSTIIQVKQVYKYRIFSNYKIF